jgi:hypothetical protein
MSAMRSGIVIGMICLTVPAVAAVDTFDGVYAGTKVLTKGPSSGCPTTEDVSITITGSVLTFTDSELRSFPIDFEPRPDGSFDEISINLGGTTVDIHGRVTGSSLEADVINPPCVHHWHLEKKH